MTLGEARRCCKGKDNGKRRERAATGLWGRLSPAQRTEGGLDCLLAAVAILASSCPMPHLVAPCVLPFHVVCHRCQPQWQRTSPNCTSSYQAARKRYCDDSPSLNNLTTPLPEGSSGKTMNKRLSLLLDLLLLAASPAGNGPVGEQVRELAIAVATVLGGLVIVCAVILAIGVLDQRKPPYPI
jgi:hypothetical protein